MRFIERCLLAAMVIAFPLAATAITIRPGDLNYLEVSAPVTAKMPQVPLPPWALGGRPAFSNSPRSEKTSVVRPPSFMIFGTGRAAAEEASRSRRVQGSLAVNMRFIAGFPGGFK